MKDGAGIVAFTGRAGSGKSTAADVLVGHGWTRVKFAGPLKAMFRALLDETGCTDPDALIEGDRKELPIPLLGHCDPRYIMQTLGTEWGRSYIDADLWVNIAMYRIQESLARGVSVVIDDCRFDNEAEMIRDLGGVICEIHGRGGSEPVTHASENLPTNDCVIYNTGSIEELRGAVTYIFTMTDAN